MAPKEEMMWGPYDQFWLAVAFLFSSVVSMIFVAVFGYFVTKFVTEIHACKKQSPATPNGCGLRTRKSWPEDRHWNGDEKAEGDGDETEGWIL